MSDIKIHSPEVTTICVCQDCKTPTRMGRHLDMDCEEIQRLRTQLASAAEDTRILQHLLDIEAFNSEVFDADTLPRALTLSEVREICREQMANRAPGSQGDKA